LGTWIDVIRDTFVALDITPAESGPFSGTVRTRQFAHLMAADVLATSQTLDRTPRLASRAPLDLLQIGMVVSGDGQLIQDGRACTLRPGDFALYESARPFTWSLRPDWHLQVFTWPRDSVPLSETRSQRLTARTVHADSALGQLLSPMLSGLLASREVSAGGAIRLADEIAELAITAALEEMEPGDAGSRDRDLYTGMLRTSKPMSTILISRHCRLLRRSSSPRGRCTGCSRDSAELSRPRSGPGASRHAVRRCCHRTAATDRSRISQRSSDSLIWLSSARPSPLCTG
jgi:hypothetical protein